MKSWRTKIAAVEGKRDVEMSLRAYRPRKAT